ncbi:hypothetical protein ACRBEV_29165 [Methylobacterium phyllosphaerae]
MMAAALLSGLATAVILAPISALAALIITPLAASMFAILACLLVAWRSSRNNLGPPDREARTDAMVAILRQVTRQGQAASPVRVRSQSVA